ncbi:hypothetical protein DMN91_008546 [Ooceraea biroi]|uniref:SAP domain-containing protein n=1 Tax=Ooceraea biroi TaxID=2015173 RepID=A0A3L8DHU4_OOCBI|nr:hypothetical protein DMN91_008546 [Ooceraea biroi]
MNPHELNVAQLKQALRERRLKTSGRKKELIIRLQNADPTGAWIQEAGAAIDAGIESEEEVAVEQEEAASEQVGDDITPNSRDYDLRRHHQ